jgi:hypothetical protein
VPQQKYHISVHRKQIFELTERKKFCSAVCFKASKYFSSQLSSTPLWMRQDGRQEEIMLLDHTSQKDQEMPDPCLSGKCAIQEIGPKGDEEVLTRVTRVREPSDFTPPSPVTSPHVADIVADRVPQSNEKHSDSKVFKPPADTSLTRTHHEALVNESGDRLVENFPCQQPISSTSPGSVSSRGEVTYAKPVQTKADIVKRLHPVERSMKSTKSGIKSSTANLYRVLSEWCTPHTHWLLGEGWSERERGIVDCSDAKLIESRRSKEDENNEPNVVSSSKGKDHPCHEEPSSGVAVMERNLDNLKIATLPPIDHSSQLQIRRKIVLQKILPLIQNLTKLQLHQISGDVTALVKTLRLEAHNITLSPMEWLITAIVFLHCLSSKNKVIAQRLQQQVFVDHQTRLQVSEDTLRPMVSIFASK